MLELVQIAGAVVIVSAFAAAQLRRTDPHRPAYLLANLTGAGTLAAVAAIGGEYGFLLSNGVWTAVSAWGLAEVVRRPRAC